MSFKDLMTDRVTILKTTGDEYTDIPASVQKSKIFIEGSDVLIESGDLVKRNMSNGAEETYEVVDPGFHEKFHGIDAHYQMDVKKLGIPEARSAVNSITYNISGTNNRVNQNSTDHSINIVNANPELEKKLEELRSEVEGMGLSSEETEESNEIIDAIETNLKQDKPSKTVVQTLLSALPTGANIASIGAFILSCL